MQLPTNEVDNEEMMGIPESLEVSPSPLLHREEDNDSQGGYHDPPGCTGTREEIGTEEGNDPLASRSSRSIGHGETVEVDHVGSDMNGRPDDHGPSGGFVESDVLIKGDDEIEGSAAEEGDKVAADREEDKDHVDVKDEGRCAGNGWGIKKQRKKRV